MWQVVVIDNKFNAGQQGQAQAAEGVQQMHPGLAFVLQVIGVEGATGAVHGHLQTHWHWQTLTRLETGTTVVAHMFSKGIVSGWMIATMVWMIASMEAAKIWIIVLITYLMALGDFTHIVVGSAEASYLVFAGELSWSDFWLVFAAPTLGGNIIGGSFIFAILSHAQIRSEKDTTAKLERDRLKKIDDRKREKQEKEKKEQLAG